MAPTASKPIAIKARRVTTKESTIDSLRRRTVEQRLRITDLEGEVAGLRAQVLDLQAEVAAERAQSNTLGGFLVNLMGAFRTLKKDSSDITAYGGTLEAVVDRMDAIQEQLEERLEEKDTTIKRLRRVAQYAIKRLADMCGERTARRSIWYNVRGYLLPQQFVMDQTLVEDVGSLFSHKTMNIHTLENNRLRDLAANQRLAPLYPAVDPMRGYAAANNVAGGMINALKVGL